MLFLYLKEKIDDQGITNSTFDNQFMTAKETIKFYENIWEEYFLDLFWNKN